MYSLMMIIYWHYYGFYWHSISIRLQTIDTWLLDFRLRHDFNNNKILLVIPANVVSVNETCYASHYCWMEMQKNIHL